MCSLNTPTPCVCLPASLQTKAVIHAPPPSKCKTFSHGYHLKGPRSTFKTTTEITPTCLRHCRKQSFKLINKLNFVLVIFFFYLFFHHFFTSTLTKQATNTSLHHKIRFQTLRSSSSPPARRRLASRSLFLHSLHLYLWLVSLAARSS